ncbi:MAG: UDP-N-acetylglucosamine--N-acetylmuramyl-(pentapeptide) pyrophosphoryl-undecaprenol N-acetylglucosamine transferase [Lentisphaerae bacterium]|nr:UDP-N-acetylglucosamine--N-acetylmuramyl-(pentapeptide) pyrophosphoryl-undecaprenol N-acetylglucosamine transferase [Lentisphaerota bacterium]
MKDLKRLIISCGGTGGHFFPGLSIAREFKAQGGEVLLLLSGVNAVNQAEIASKYSINAVALPQMPVWKRHPLRFITGVLKGFFNSRKVIREFAPQAILGMGSFAMTPVLLAGYFAKIPLALHDGNARIGRGNRIFSRISKVLGAGFPPVNPEKCHCRIADTGMPVRPELLRANQMERNEAIRKLNALFDCDLQEDLTTILIFGGSQGAAVFNTILPQALQQSCFKERFQVLHLCGKGKKLDAEKIYLNADFPVLLLESTDKMEYFLGAADAVFCRSGGSTLAELAIFGKGAFLIPYPYAAEGHQLDNAGYFARNNAAVIITNDEFTVERACSLLEKEVCSRELIAVRNAAAATLARPDAAKVMLKEISSIIN